MFKFSIISTELIDCFIEHDEAAYGKYERG